MGESKEKSKTPWWVWPLGVFIVVIYLAGTSDSNQQAVSSGANEISKENSAENNDLKYGMLEEDYDKVRFACRFMVKEASEVSLSSGQGTTIRTYKLIYDLETYKIGCGDSEEYCEIIADGVYALRSSDCSMISRYS